MIEKKFKMCLTRKICKVELHSFESFFDSLVQTLAFFRVNHIHFFQLDDTIFSTLIKKSIIFFIAMCNKAFDFEEL